MDPDPNPDPSPFLSDFKDAKQIFFLFFLEIAQRRIISSLKNVGNFLLKFLAKILFCRHYFCPLNTFMRKGKDPEPEPDPDPYL